MRTHVQAWTKYSCRHSRDSKLDLHYFMWIRRDRSDYSFDLPVLLQDYCSTVQVCSSSAGSGCLMSAEAECLSRIGTTRQRLRSGKENGSSCHALGRHDEREARAAAL